MRVKYLASVLSVILVNVCALGQSVGHPSESASELVEQFKSETVFWKQFEVAKKIVALHDKRVLHDLEPWLCSKDLLSRGNAAFVFASFGDDRGFQVIKAILEENSRRCEPPFLEEDRSNRRQDRYYAAHLFGDLKDARAVSILVPLLRDKDVKWIVPWSLGEIGDKSAVPPLIETLDDKCPDMRVLAIYALEQLNAKEALPKILALLDDNEKTHFDGLVSVADAARKAVIQLERRP